MDPVKIMRLVANVPAPSDDSMGQFITVQALDNSPGMIAFAISNEDAIAARCLVAILTDPRLQSLNNDDVHQISMTFLYRVTKAQDMGEPFNLGAFLFYDRDDHTTIAMQHIAQVFADTTVEPSNWSTIAYRISWLSDFAVRFQAGMYMLEKAMHEVSKTIPGPVIGSGLFGLN